MCVVVFRASNDDYSTANLQTMRDAVYFNLFDECVVDMVQVCLCINNSSQYFQYFLHKLGLS